MDDLTKSKARRGGRPKSMRPEFIDIGDDKLRRNDLIAKDHGASVRTLDRGDRDGAPYTYVAGVKYRPVKGYQQYLASRIRRRDQPTPRRRGRPPI